MTYQIIETSRDDGQPIELYKVSYGVTNYYYTSGDTPITYLSNNYTPTPIKRSQINPGSDINKATLTITLAANSPLGEIFRISPPSEPVVITVFAEHYLDNSFQVIWKGRILQCEWSGDSTIKLTTDNVFTSLNRPGLRLRDQVQCPLALYGIACGVNKEVYRQNTTLSGLSGLTLTVTSEIGRIDNWYAGGFVTWQNSVNANTERRAIRFSTGSTGQMTLSSLPVGLSVGQAISLFPGCSHILEDANGCAPKFNNFTRYGGVPYMPQKNPFRSTIY